MICALCRHEPSLRQSHIISEFMFAPLYDEKHRFIVVSSVSTKPNRILQKGLREKLLCDECERRLCRYERYASDVFFGKGTTKPHRTPTGFLFTGLEYKPLKLFFMSLLWRLGATSIPALKGVKLGPHQERLRLLLAADDPAHYLTFPAMLTGLTSEGRLLGDLIVPPHHTRVEGRHVWAVVISGYWFHFFVSNQQLPRKLWGAFLQADGALPVQMTDIEKVLLFKRWFAVMAAAEEVREQTRKQRSR